MGESSYRPVVEIDTGYDEYEVSGFASEEEAEKFITSLSRNTNDRVLVRGPF